MAARGAGGGPHGLPRVRGGQRSGHPPSPTLEPVATEAEDVDAAPEAALPAGGPGDLEGLEPLLTFLREERGFDFRGYKRASLARRIAKRMTTVGAGSYDAYRDVLEIDAHEWTALLDTVLINLTSFFRDEPAWEALRTQHLPAIVRRGGKIRAWCAGCASGEEAYSLAMVLCEILGPEEFRQRVKIYATDVDDAALAAARSGTFTERAMAPVSPELRERYFDRSGDRWTFRRDLRRSIIFGRNDLVQDAPISHVDVLLCRNTLMYFVQESQARIAARLHFALAEDGVLVLGRAETLLSQAALFTPLDLGNRIFTAGPRSAREARGARGAPPWATQAAADRADGSVREESPAAAVRRQALLTAPSAQLVLDAAGALMTSNLRADALFGLGERDLGSPFQDLEVSYRPVGLRSAVEDARASGAPVWVREVAWRVDGESRVLDIMVVPLQGEDHRVLGTSIVFTDVTREHALAGEYQRARSLLETAHEELQSTHEELETTNEELQSTVEELETTNEELQSTNEELETMNEELQSMNEELQSSNQDLRTSTGDAEHRLDAAGAALASMTTSVVVLDRFTGDEQGPERARPDRGADGAPDPRSLGRVRVWNAATTDLWGVTAEEAVGADLAELGTGLPLEEVRAAVEAAAHDGGAATVDVDATERHGRRVRLRVAVSPLMDGDGVSAGAILITELDR